MLHQTSSLYTLNWWYRHFTWMLSASNFSDSEKGCSSSPSALWRHLWYSESFGVRAPAASLSQLLWHAALGEQIPPSSSSRLLPPCYCRAGHCVEKSRPVFLYVLQLYNVYRKSSCFSECFINVPSEKGTPQPSVCWHHNIKWSVSHNGAFNILWKLACALTRTSCSFLLISTSKRGFLSKHSCTSTANKDTLYG